MLNNKLIQIILLVLFISVSDNLSQTIPAKKIGEIQGSSLVITHPISDLNQAIMQEVGDCDMVINVSIQIDNNKFYLYAEVLHGENSYYFLATMFENNGDIFMARFETNAAKDICKGNPCSKCDPTIIDGRISTCPCIRGSTGAGCLITTESSLTPGSMGYVERFLAN